MRNAKKEAREKKKICNNRTMWLKFEMYVSTLFHILRESRSDVKATWQERVKLSPLYKCAM